MEDYYYKEKGRSFKNVLIGIFVLFLSISFLSIGYGSYLSNNSIWSSDNLFELGIGLFLLFLFFSCVYAFINGENWELGIKNNHIWWDYPRWPKSKGSIELKNISKVTIRDDSFCNIKIEFNSGENKKNKISWQ